MFDALDMLKNGKLTVEEAKAIAGIGQVLVSTAKVEADFLKEVGGIESGFITNSKSAQSGTINEVSSDLPAGYVSRKIHRIA